MKNIKAEDIRKGLMELRDEKYREFHSGLVPGEDKIIGIRIPVIRKYARELFKEYHKDVDLLLENTGVEYYEEKVLKGMLIGMEKKGAEQLLKRIEYFVPLIDSWAVCDTFCAGLKETAKYREEVYGLLEKYMDSGREFYVRFGLVMLLDYYVDEEYLERIFQWTEKAELKDYYAAMGAAWLISVCFVKFYDRTLEFMKTAQLDTFTYNKALQKARESFRLSEEQKRELKEIKRKAGE